MTHAVHTPFLTASDGKPAKRREKENRSVRNNRADSGVKTSNESVPESSVLDSKAVAALRHVLASAQTGTYDGGVVISFAALAAVRSALESAHD